MQEILPHVLLLITLTGKREVGLDQYRVFFDLYFCFVSLRSPVRVIQNSSPTVEVGANLIHQRRNSFTISNELEVSLLPPRNCRVHLASASTLGVTAPPWLPCIPLTFAEQRTLIQRSSKPFHANQIQFRYFTSSTDIPVHRETSFLVMNLDRKIRIFILNARRSRIRNTHRVLLNIRSMYYVASYVVLIYVYDVQSCVIWPYSVIIKLIFSSKSKSIHTQEKICYRGSTFFWC